jgi:hypothetical protein
MSGALAACLMASGCGAPVGSAPSASAVVVVPASANIFGAGQESAPDPGGGGGGTLPPLWPLPSGATRFVTFPSVTGEVNPITNFESVGYNGPGERPQDARRAAERDLGGGLDAGRLALGAEVDRHHERGVRRVPCITAR